VSFARLVYYSALLAGWAAFAAWAVAEALVFGRLLPSVEPAVVGGLVGAGIGLAVNVAAALGTGGWKTLGSRAAIGGAGGVLGGAVGASIGNAVYLMGSSGEVGWALRAVGWLLMGMGIGVIDGIQERSVAKIRNGLIGGALGGLVGGLLFDPLANLVASATGMSSRATAFVVLGLTIGGLIGLVQVVMRDAWLTVVDGYRPGRQLLLSRPITILGSAEHLPLPFIGAMNAGIPPEQLRISRQADGGFVLEEVVKGATAAVNQQAIQRPTRLHDQDVIRLGPNIIRFNERRSATSAVGAPPPATATGTATGPVAPPPPPPRPPTPPSPRSPTRLPALPPAPKEVKPSGAAARSTAGPSAPAPASRPPPPPPPPPPRR
jgi:hypothetical protein